MVFGLFVRKPTLDSQENDQDARLPTPTPSNVSVARHSPFRFPTVLRSTLAGSTSDLTLKDSDRATESVIEGGNNAQPPPATPSPPPVAGPSQTKVLHDLMLTIPPKTLHAYTLAQLRPQPLPSTTVPCPPSPDTVAKLATFFSSLAPPPLLHCARCHKDFFEIENEDKDKACRMAHDDDSALVSRIYGGSYETLWGCCGQTASGDGSEGPPDGWCYEGRHTTDARRARFRADSTMHDDKLTSCLKLNCRGIRDQLPWGDGSPSRTLGASSTRKSNPSPARSQASALTSRSVRKRPRKSLKEASGSENEADAESVASRGVKAKNKEEEASMTIDGPSSVKPKSRKRTQPVGAGDSPVKPASKAAKPKSRTILSQSHTHLVSDSEASTHDRPRTRSHVRGESRGRTASKLTRADISERAKRASKRRSRSPPSEEPKPETGSDQERGRDRKKRRLRG